MVGQDRGRSSGAPGASFDPTVVRRHQDGQQPTIPEPVGMNRARWDELVFNAWERTHPAEQTVVLDRATVPTIRVCIQSPDTSYTGQRLAPFSEASWWRRHIMYWTGLSWSGEIRIAACTDEPQEGWIYVREAKPDEGPAGALVYTDSRRVDHPHAAGRWLWSEIAWRPDHVPNLDESGFEHVLAHELGHALGFSHAQGSGFLGGGEEESSLAQLAYRVGPNVRYPGLVRAGAEVDPDPASPDRAALMALYDATNGHNWTDSTNWGTDEPLDRWHGVTTGDTGRVVRLNLHANNLTGTLPPALGRLSSLAALDLHGNNNNLTGPIPPELGALSNLEYLELSNNNLTGPIPPALGALSNLVVLFLYGNNLTGPIPPALGALTNLEVLFLFTNDLTGPIPPALGALSNLVVLILDSNNLAGPIPPALGALSSLRHLSLRSNNLTGPIPTALGDLSGLGILQLGFNNLTGALPLSLANLQYLEQLYIDNNAGLCASANAAFQAWLATVRDFRGDTCADGVPPTVSDEDLRDRAALMALYDATNGNNWTDSTNWGTDEAFYDWHGVTTDGAGRVIHLNLDSNNLTGPIPPELGDLSSLRSLGLDSNNLTGPIPPALGDLSNLAELNLHTNNLTGPIPPELGALSNLEFLNLYGNNLTRPIPPALGDLSRLVFLQFGDNTLTGPIPPELGALSNLDSLGLGPNNLTGPVPPELGALSNLGELNLNSNNLTGSLPSSLTNLRNLKYLLIENNAGLCAPADAAFQAWLGTVGDFRGEICADEPAPTMLILSAASAPAEGGNPVTVTATLDNPAPANGTTVTLTTGGTATLDTDYTLSSTTITLAAGETAGTVTITVTDDAEDDDGETIVIDAESTSPALTAEPLTLTIEDDDGPAPTMLTLSAASAPAEGGNPVTVTAMLDHPAPATGLTVTLTTGGTATLDTDYTLSSTTITLAAGETAGTVTITVTDDAEDDDGETIVIDAESTSPALTAEPLTLTIEDNDVTPVPALPLRGVLLLGLLLTLLGAVRMRMRERTAYMPIARGT